MLRQCLISNSITYGSGVYGAGYYGGFSEVYIADDWQYTKSINSQKQFSFTIISNYNNLTITPGLEVIFLIDSVIAFKGIIETIKKYETMPGYLYYDVTCVTFDKLTQKRKIAQVFTSQTAGYIINWMITNILNEENITAGTIQDGPTFTKVIFNYSSCYNALNKIMTACPGYNWHVDNDKKLHFYAKTSFKSAYTIDNDLTNIGGAGWTTVPASDIGTNYNTGKKWYWTYNSYKITQDEVEAVLTAADAIRVSYYGLRKIFLKYDDNAEIANRVIIDGNSGKYEEIFNNQDIVTNADAVNYAKGLIEKYKDQKPVTMILEQDIYDFDINMLVKIEKTLFNINDWYLVESITARQSNPEKVLYTIKLLSGEYVGGWEDYFAGLLEQQTDIQESDTIIIFSGLNENYDWEATTTIQVMEILTPSLTLYPSLTLSPGTE